MDTNCKHADGCGLKTVVEAESWPSSVFHIKRNLLLTTHLEESFVLDSGKAGVVQEIAEHKSSWFCVHDWLAGQVLVLLLLAFRITIFVWRWLYKIWVFRPMLPADVVFSRLLVQLSFHEHVKKETNSCIIGKFLVDVDCPEERMRFRIFSIGKADKVNSYMANHTFIIESLAYWVTDLEQVQAW